MFTHGFTIGWLVDGMRLFAIAILALLLFGCAQEADQTKNFENLKSTADEGFVLHVLYFYGATCRYSDISTPYVNELRLNYTKNVVLHMYEIGSEENRKFYDEIADAYGIPVGQRGVPVAFIDGEYLMGFQKINNYLKNEIEVCLRIKCPSPLDAPKNRSIAKPI